MDRVQSDDDEMTCENLKALSCNLEGQVSISNKDSVCVCEGGIGVWVEVELEAGQNP